MARQVGIIPLTGTLKGINFYVREGAPLARKGGGGFNSDAIKNKPKMVRVRENASEFGHCSSVKKHFRLSLRPFLCIRKDGKLHGRMMQLFMKLKNMDRINDRGQRRVGPGMDTEAGKQLLRNFVFTPDCDVFGIMGAAGNYDFVTGTYSVSNFDVKHVWFPKGATHLALTLGLLHFNFETMEQELKLSAPLYLDKEFTGTSISLSVGTPSVSGVAVAVLGMKFYEEVNGVYYIFRSAKAVGVEVLGVWG
ncbi:MAG: hypothetical protein KDC78_09215 [Aequorivita sp.]|nr:hypothetical protein [Aequorivita sp.]